MVGRRAEELRADFHIENHFTPEQIQEMQRDTECTAPMHIDG